MRIVLVILLLALTACDTVTRRAGGDIESTRILYSEAGGLFSIFTGRVSSCVIITSKDSQAKVKKLIFDASKNTCSAEVSSK